MALCLGANRCRTYVVLVTNENDVDATKRIMSQAALGEQVEVMAPHANTAGEDAQLSSSHPMMLAFGHRSVMRAALSQYDLFVYLEADMLMLLPQLQAWARDEAALLRDPTARANGVHRGFYRWEVHNGSPIMSDDYPLWLPRTCSVPDVANYPCRYNVLAPAPYQGSRWFIGLPNPYSAAWVMPRDRMRALLAGPQAGPNVTKAFGTLGETLKAGNVKSNRPESRFGNSKVFLGCPWGVRECAASGDAWKIPRFESRKCTNRFLVPYHAHEGIRPSLEGRAGLQHLGDNYPGLRSVSDCLRGSASPPAPRSHTPEWSPVLPPWTLVKSQEPKSNATEKA